jgi:hypothetical protein
MLVQLLCTSAQVLMMAQLHIGKRVRTHIPLLSRGQPSWDAQVDPYVGRQHRGWGHLELQIFGCVNQTAFCNIYVRKFWRQQSLQQFQQSYHGAQSASDHD